MSSSLLDVKTWDCAPSSLLLRARYQEDVCPMSKLLGLFNASPGPQSPLGSSNAASAYMFGSDVSIGKAQRSIADPL